MTNCQQNKHGLDRQEMYPPFFLVTRLLSGVKSTLFLPPLSGQLTGVRFTMVNWKLGVTLAVPLTMVNLSLPWLAFSSVTSTNVWDQIAHRDYVTRPQTQRMVCLWFYLVWGVKRQLHWISSILFDFVRLYWFDWFENRTHRKIGVRLCSIAEPNRTIGVRLGSIGILFGYVRLDTSGKFRWYSFYYAVRLFTSVHRRGQNLRRIWSNCFFTGPICTAMR